MTTVETSNIKELNGIKSTDPSFNEELKKTEEKGTKLVKITEGVYRTSKKLED